MCTTDRQKADKTSTKSAQNVVRTGTKGGQNGYKKASSGSDWLEWHSCGIVVFGYQFELDGYVLFLQVIRSVFCCKLSGENAYFYGDRGMENAGPIIQTGSSGAFLMANGAI